MQKNVPKPDFAHDGKAATLLEKISILDHVRLDLRLPYAGFALKDSRKAYVMCWCTACAADSVNASLPTGPTTCKPTGMP